ncbi:hypothetical protein ACQVP2_14945 [Methylobacterium aquaticum]|jgi:hypothetical protein|uniref:hypothetical protein n=1 Tax=Methylobacterium aquaticum TaxID=270351 RepID=UPI003D17DD44
MAEKSFVKRWLRNATLVAVLTTGIPGLVCAAPDDATAPEAQKKSRSKFEYHDGRAEEKRPYRRPNPDVDPTNLRYEELIARINALEERIEALEYQSKISKRVQ